MTCGFLLRVVSSDLRLRDVSCVKCDFSGVRGFLVVWLCSQWQFLLFWSVGFDNINLCVLCVLRGEKVIFLANLLE